MAQLHLSPHPNAPESTGLRDTSQAQGGSSHSYTMPGVCLYVATISLVSPSPLPSQNDPQLEQERCQLIVTAATMLDKARMIRFHEPTGTLHSTDLGRTASHFYIKHVSIEVSLLSDRVQTFRH